MEPNGSTWSQKEYQKETKSVQNGAKNIQCGEHGAQCTKSAPKDYRKNTKHDAQKRSARGRQQPFGLLGPECFFYQPHGEQMMILLIWGPKTMPKLIKNQCKN